MNNCFLLDVINENSIQSAQDYSFIGGHPKLPRSEGIPHCKLCNEEQSFFFQVAMPDGHEWDGLSIAIFACTSCIYKDHSIPTMLKGPLRDIDIPEGFLDSYQINFRFLVFKTIDAYLCHDYQERVKFKRLRLRAASDPNADGHKIGGNPNWILRNETPKSYGGKTPMFFLLQILEDYEFEIEENAPRQVTFGLDGAPYPLGVPFYHLFIGNKIFLFGTTTRADPKVYAITQVD